MYSIYFCNFDVNKKMRNLILSSNKIILSSLQGRVQQTLISGKSSGNQPPTLQQNKKKLPGEADLRSAEPA